MDWREGELEQGLRLYRARQFFAAHEAWETAWLCAPEPEKTFLQALIQVTAAFHHLQRGNLLGARRLLEAALRRLAPYPEYFGGLLPAALRDEIRERLRRLDSGEQEFEPVSIEPL